MASRPAPRVPAGKGSLARLAEIYLRQRDLDDDFERALEGSPISRDDAVGDHARSSWTALMHSGEVVMSQPPTSMGEMLLTLGMAANYIDTVLGQAEGADETICRGVATALNNAVRFLLAHDAAVDLPVEVSPLIAEFASWSGLHDSNTKAQAA